MALRNNEHKQNPEQFQEDESCVIVCTMDNGQHEGHLLCTSSLPASLVPAEMTLSLGIVIISSQFTVKSYLATRYICNNQLISLAGRRTSRTCRTSYSLCCGRGHDMNMIQSYDHASPWCPSTLQACALHSCDTKVKEGRGRKALLQEY